MNFAPKSNTANDYQNLSQKEIDKFTVTDSWWNVNGAFKSLHDINPLRLAFIKSQAPLTDKKILDVGCGGGILAEALAKAGAQVTGIDLNASALEQARAHAKLQDLSIKYQKITVEELANANEQFDIITCMELLEHVPNPQSIIRACAKLIKSKGKLFFATLNRNPKSFLAAIVAAEYILKLLPKGTHEFNKFIKPSELARWLRAADCEITALMGMNYNPLNKTYHLTKNISVNYLLCAQKC